MIRFTAPLQLWTSTDGSWHFITVPDEFVGEIKAHSLGAPRGFGSVKVEVAVDDVVWRTSIFPMKSGGYFLPMKIASCRKAGITAGDDVTVGLELL
jgi:hypothetical protein